MGIKIALTLVATLAIASATHAVEYCAAPNNTLHFDCAKLCDNQLMPCMKAADSCAIECFPLAVQTQFVDKAIKVSWLTFLIPFGNASVPAPTKAAATGNATNSSSADATISFASIFAMKSNDEIKRVEQIMAPKNVTIVTIRGGSTPNGTVKGQVANVAFADNLLGKSKQVLSLSLESVNLTTAVKPLLDWIVSSKLNTLSLSNGLLTAFPDKALKISSLRKLILSYNDIPSVNETLTKTSLLQTLDLSANGVTAMPTAKTFPKLKSLMLAKNAITTVPKESARVGLIELYLNENKISKYEAANKDLISLDLTSNELTDVPSVIGTHKKLKNLRLSLNNITSIPTNLSLSSLETLDLVANKLTTFETKFSGLKKLDLSNNTIKQFPPVIFTLSKLEILLIAHNKLYDFTFTKSQALFLSKLKSFAIHGNTPSLDCAASNQQTIHKFTYCVTDSPAAAVTKSPKHKHHKHKNHKDHNAELPTVAPTTAAPSAVDLEMTTQQLAATDASAAVTSGNDSSDSELVVALGGAAVGAVVAVVVLIAIAVHDKRVQARDAAFAISEDVVVGVAGASREAASGDEGIASVLAEIDGSDDDEAGVVCV